MEEDRIAQLVSTLVQSLYGAAMVAMGKVPDPMTGESTVDLGRARFNIDLLEALEARTRGNLSGPERSLLQTLLTNLRLTFVAEMRRTREKPAEGTGGPEDSGEPDEAEADSGESRRGVPGEERREPSGK